MEKVTTNYSRKIINGDVVDANSDYYLVRTGEKIFKLPTGQGIVYDGAIIDIGNDQYLRLNVPNADENAESISADDALDYINENAEEFEDLQGFDEDKHYADWPERTTKLLIELYREKRELVEKRKIKTLKKMWIIISEIINEKGHNYSSTQCQTKWKSLERSFKKTVLNNRKTGRGRQTCPYEKELSEILLKRKSIIPPLLLDSESEKTDIQNKECIGFGNSVNVTTTDSEVTIPTSNHETPSTSIDCNKTLNSSRTRNHKRRNVRTEVQNLRESIEQRHKQKKEMEEKKFDQCEKYLQEIKRKNYLLERLVENTIRKNN